MAQAHKFQDLEAKIDKLVEVLWELREKNTDLKAQVSSLKSELKEKNGDNKSEGENSDDIERLRRENRDLTKDRMLIKTKVETMLRELEKIESF